MNKTITLTDAQKKLVEKRVQSGSYTSESEVIAESLHLLDIRDRFLLQKALAGVNSGKSIRGPCRVHVINFKLARRIDQLSGDKVSGNPQFHSFRTSHQSDRVFRMRF